MMNTNDRSKVVGLLAHGSVVRGDFSPASDIDLLVVLDAPSAPPRQTSGNGFFRFDFFFHTRKDLEIAHFVLIDPFLTTILRHAVIIHDPTGLLRKVKRLALREGMRKRHRLGRSRNQLETLHQRLQAMKEAAGTQDLSKFYLAYYLFGTTLLGLPMIAHGIPFSNRRAVSALRTTLLRTGASRLASSVCRALNLQRVDTARLHQLYNSVRSVAEILEKQRGDPGFIHAVRDGIAGILSLINEGANGAALWGMFVTGSVLARSLPAEPLARQAIRDITRIMHLRTKGDLDRTVSAGEKSLRAMERYLERVLVSQGRPTKKSRLPRVPLGT